MVKGRQLGYDFHRQKPIGNFIYDFFCFELKLVVEIDGITHLDRLVQITDEVKADYLSELDLKLLRFTDDEVIGNSNQVYEKLKNFISEFESAKVK
jgi:very-short-patch-repair endonuclease